MNVEICRDPSLWDAYVDSSPAAWNYHRWLWRQPIEDTFGHQALYLAAVEGGTIRGVLPLVSIRSRLFGKFLVSIPFFSYGGVLADTAEVQNLLLARAVETATELGARHIELRQGNGCTATWCDVAAKIAMQVSLPPAGEELWNRLSAKLRKRIRYARNHGLVTRWGGSESVGSFYRVFATNMRNLGTPVYPRQWFENLCRYAGKEIRIVTLQDDGQPVAAAFLISFRETLELPWAASLPDSRRKFCNLLLYWTVLEWAVENGYRRVDLGRCTPGSGNHEFKRHWSDEERPLHWYYWLAPGVPVPQLRPDNPRYGWAVRVWKHLPLFVANGLGPRIVRSIP